MEAQDRRILAKSVASAVSVQLAAPAAVVHVEAPDFMTILDAHDHPLVVVSEPRFWSPSHGYLTYYKGLIFMAKSKAPLPLPEHAETWVGSKVSGRLVHLPTIHFVDLLKNHDRPLVVVNENKEFGLNYFYLAPYRGFIFLTKTKAPLNLGADVEVIQTGKLINWEWYA